MKSRWIVWIFWIICCGCSRGTGCYFSSCWSCVCSSMSSKQHCGCIVIAQISWTITNFNWRTSVWIARLRSRTSVITIFICTIWTICTFTTLLNGFWSTGIAWMKFKNAGMKIQDWKCGNEVLFSLCIVQSLGSTYL